MNRDPIPAYTVLKECLCCGDSSLIPVLNLGTQPLANLYHHNDTPLEKYPLGVNLCTLCFHLQQWAAVEPDRMFKHYLYVSGTSKTLRDYFDWFAERVDANFPATGEKKVLDIACNDGTQLAAFIKRGWRVWGVDPAENLIAQARATGATVVCDYWTIPVAERMREYFDVIVAQNVCAHTSYPLRFLLACREVMHWDSKLLIQTSQADMVHNGEFDTIYHEHISFFSLNSMYTLAKRAGLVLEGVEITPVHGGSYVFRLGYGTPDQSVADRLAEEKAVERYELDTYREFAKRAQETVVELRHTLERYKQQGYRLVGFGAAAKGNTLLNFAGITLDYIVDDNPLKQHLYTPGINIPIYPPKQLAEESGPVALVPLAWNFFDEIRQKVKNMRPTQKDIFVTYFPSVSTRI